MGKRKPSTFTDRDFLTIVGIAGLALYFIGGTVLSFLVEFPIIAGIVFVAIVLCAFSVGNFLGIGDSKEERAAAEIKLTEAEDHRKESTALLKRNEAVLEEMVALKKALEAGYLEDLSFIENLNALPIRARVSKCIVVGEYGPHDGNAYQEARSMLTEMRTRQWKEARRFGQKLLSVVESQGGICGDLSKDPLGKGCGCYLYGLPPTAVHLDHIVPSSKGGQNNLENLQALCSACNVSAGARQDQQLPLKIGVEQ